MRDYKSKGHALKYWTNLAEKRVDIVAPRRQNRCIGYLFI